MAPSSAYLAELAKKSLISCSSEIASSAPATSAKVVFGTSSLCSFARDLPKLNTLFPPCDWLSIKKKSKPIIRIGAIENRKLRINGVFGTSIFQPFCGGLALKASIIVGSWRTTYEASTLEAPLMVRPDFSSTRIF